MDIFEEIEQETADFLKAIVDRVTEDVGQKMRNELIDGLPSPSVSLSWDGTTITCVTSYEDLGDGFGDTIGAREVEILWLDTGSITPGGLGYHPENIGEVFYDAATGDGLSAPQKRECAAFLRRMADAMDFIADKEEKRGGE